MGANDSVASERGTTEIRLALSTSDIERCRDVMLQLRTHIAPDRFVPLIQSLRATQSYRLALLEEDGVVRAVAGFRELDMLSRGHYVYVDDLVTDEAYRSRGHGKALLDWVCWHARELGCSRVDLDSGPERERAHAFYERCGMQLASLHFAIEID